MADESQARLAALTSWANTKDRSARTLRARLGLEEKFLREAGGDPKRAAAIRKAYYAKLAMKGREAKKRKAQLISQQGV